MIARSVRRTATILCFLAAGLTLPATASAQLQVVGYGGAEWHFEDIAILTLGGAVQTTNLGWGLTGNLLGIMIEHHAMDPSERIRGINPSAGVQYRWHDAAAQIRAGYLFLDRDSDAAAPLGAFVGTRGGVTTTAQYNFWGTGMQSLEAITNFNWGDRHLWARGRGTQRVTGPGATGVNLGGELIGQGNADFRAGQAGVIAEWVLPAVRLIGGAGYKVQNVGSNSPYVRAEFVIVR